MRLISILSFFLLIFLVSCADKVETSKKKPQVDNGVSLKLANSRKAKIANVHYQLAFDIPADKAERIQADLIVTLSLSSNKKPLILDFKEPVGSVKDVLVEDVSIPYEFENEHLIIAPENLNIGKNEFNIKFTAGDLSLNRNDDFLYTLLVPDRARTLFPVFDQPNLKASYKLQLTVPESWDAVSNGKAIKETAVDGRKVIDFESTKAISSYLFAFAAGRFEKITDAASGMTMYHREKDTSKVNRNAPEIFSLHQKSIDWLETYTGIGYPYDKFDFVLIPPFQYGGMEHPGNVFYRESALFLDEGASINQKLRRASLIAHETAHMWFGNLVTMDWFNDVWLKEVFANQMASKIMHPNFPEVSHELNFLLSYYPRALNVDRSEGTHPIQQQLGNLQNAGTLYGNIIYNKAPIVMRNLETLMGEASFQKALQEYLRNFSGDNATWDDLISIMKKFTDKNLDQWNKDWVKGKGIPSYDISMDENVSHILFKQTKKINGQVWPQLVYYSTSFDSALENKIFLDTPEKKAPYKRGNIPAFVNTNGRGYGYFKITQDRWNQLLTTYGNSPKEIARASFWLNTWEGILNGDLSPDLAFDALSKTVVEEKNPLIISNNLNTLNTIFWQFFDGSEREQKQNQVENTVYNRLISEQDPSVKRLLYNNLVAITSSKKGGQRLFEIWKSKGDNIKLKLSENELVNLSYHIRLRAVKGAENILELQLATVKNEDRMKKMRFVIPALSPDEKVRDEFFNMLKNPANRGSEPWVLEALSFIHHPLRQSVSKKYVKESLELIEEIQETGDIFFPARWLGATLGRYNTLETTKVVRDFLASNEKLSPKLRDKVLQASDMLFRSAEINNRKTRIDNNR